MATGKYNHISLDDRKQIQRMLRNGARFWEIAEEIGRDPSSVGREVRRNRTLLETNDNKTADRNDCKHLYGCEVRGLCGGCQRIYCRNCLPRDCRELCGLYAPRTCTLCDRAPYVCDGCRHMRTCPLPRYTYRAGDAQARSDARAAESREGLDMTREEAALLVSEVRDGLSRKQSVHHIFQTRDLPRSERTFYRYVAEGKIDVIPLELSRAVRYKRRRRRPSGQGGPSAAALAGRTYGDFMALPEFERDHRTEGDTVWGPASEPESLLTLHRADLHFQIYAPIPARTPAEVARLLDWLELLCGSPEAFADAFDPLLVDRGPEFSDPWAMEASSLAEGGRRCRVFYADPQRPDQKGACEKNHVELRKACPKGTSFAGMTAGDAAELASHVNSTVRRKCGESTPMALAQAALPKGLVEGLGYRLVDPLEVCCAPNAIWPRAGK